MYHFSKKWYKMVTIQWWKFNSFSTSWLQYSSCVLRVCFTLCAFSLSMPFFTACLNFLYRSLGEYRLFFLLIAMSTSLTPLSVATTAWFSKDFLINPVLPVFKLFVPLSTLFFLSLQLIPVFPTWYLNVILFSSINKFYDWVNTWFGRTKLETTLWVIFLYIMR